MMHSMDIGLPATQIARDKVKDCYPVFTGRMIFDQLTMSGLNSVPVQMHSQRALRGFRTAGTPPVKPEEVAELLLVEPTPVFYWNQDGEWECVENLIKANETDVYQIIMPGDLPDVIECMLRHFKLQGERWQIYDTKLSYWASSGTENDKSSGSKPAAEFRVYDEGEGILYKPQWIWQRLEEIRWGVRQETSDFALSLLIIGMVSPNPEAALAKLEAGKRIANIPGAGSVQVERVGDSRIPDQLETEYDKLEAAYFRMCNLYDTTNQPDRPVGFDLQLRLEPQVAFVEALREKIKGVYEMLDYTDEIKFKPLETKTVTDQSLAATTYINLVAAGLMDSSRAKELIAELWPE